jgi:hypothetical protein
MLLNIFRMFSNISFFGLSHPREPKWPIDSKSILKKTERLEIFILDFCGCSIALLAGTASIRRPHLHPVGTAGMPTMQELLSSANIDRLLSVDFDDWSLLFPRETKH